MIYRYLQDLQFSPGAPACFLANPPLGRARGAYLLSPIGDPADVPDSAPDGAPRCGLR